jgi:hypothetical protein
MTSPDRDYEDVLRRVLRTAAESVEPAADSLELIRRRVDARRPSPFMLTEFLVWFQPILLRLQTSATAVLAWAQALLDRLQLPARVGPVLVRLRPLVAWVRPVLTPADSEAARERPSAAHRSQPPPTGLRAWLWPVFARLGPAASWLKPVLAVAGAVAIVVAGVFALGQATQFVTPANQNQVTHPGVPPHKLSPAPTSAGPPGFLPGNQSATPTSAVTQPGTGAVSSCPATTPKATPTAVASSPAPTPTPTVTPTSTPTDTASPTVSPTNTGGAGAGAAAEVASLSAQKVPVPCASPSARLPA